MEDSLGQFDYLILKHIIFCTVMILIIVLSCNNE